VPGWLAATLDADTVDFAHARRTPPGGWQIGAYGTRRASEMHLEGHQCTTMLRPGEYQLLMVEAPNVPAAELKNAIRWKVKDMVEYKIDEGTIDILDIPPADPAAASRARPMYAVAARNELLQGRIRELEAARIPLSVIDIPETAQRNVAALYEGGERGVALAYFGQREGLLTINFRSDLYLARRLEVGVEELAGDAGGEGGALSRVALEIQRTLDHFDRQFRHVAVAKLVIAPTPRPTRLAEFLQARFELQVVQADLREVLAFERPPEEQAQWKLFHHFGAALRT